MESTKNIWKPELYRIQLESPKPKAILSYCNVERPHFYGEEYHGVMPHREAAMLLLDEPNGAFFIRKGSESNDFFTLTWRFNDKIHHYKMYYDGKHYVKDKKYDSVYDLVADGLILMHMELKAQHIIRMMDTTVYQESPYVTLNRRKLRALNSQNVKLGSMENLPSNDFTVEKPKENAKQIESVKIHQQLQPTYNPLVNLKYSKPHSFKVHTFKGLTWCELCANFLWGFTAQGVKCEDCGFIAHSKCSERVPSHCLPDLKKLRGVFGVDLTTLLSAHATTPTDAQTSMPAALPFVVEKCVREIEARGMTSEGIYRISGFADEIEALKLAFDKEGPAAELSGYSVNVVAGTLKLYLRLLPLPLLTDHAHPLLLQASYAKTSSEQVLLLRVCLAVLPPAHYHCLRFMIQHLYRVCQMSSVNKMSSHNLSTVLAPTLVATPPSTTYLTMEIQALQALIQLCPEVYC